jgi:bla regulator protein BlaR1
VDNYIFVIDKLFNYVFYLSALGTILLPIIILIKRVTKNLTGSYFQYLIWFILVLRLLLPITPISSLSIYNYLPAMDQYSYSNTMYNLHASVSDSSKEDYYIPSLPQSEESTGVKYNVTSITDKVKNYIGILYNNLPYIWSVGMGVLLFTYLLANLVFRKKIRKSIEIKDEDILEELSKCKRIIGIENSIPLTLTKHLKSPAVLGMIRPSILIPEKTLELLDKEELNFILLHELSHIKRRDLIVSYIITLLTMIYWFNPFLWYAFRRMKEDLEISCDAKVLLKIEENKIQRYGNTIIKLAQNQKNNSWIPGIASIVNSKSKMKRRITMIKLFERKTQKLTILAIAALLIFGTAALTQAKALAFKPLGSKQKVFDKMDYPFLPDEQAVGKWIAIDYVKNIKDFTPSKISWHGELFLKSMDFASNGEMAVPIIKGMRSSPEILAESMCWTKGIILNYSDKTASKYTILKIGKSEYMFMEWKSGDYTIRGKKPYY